MAEVRPGLLVTWSRHVDVDPEESTIRARFSWCQPHDIISMDRYDASLALEHYVDWSPATPAPVSSLDMLQKFKELHKSGALTATEFARANELWTAARLARLYYF